MDNNRTKHIIEGFEDDFATIVEEFSEKFPDLKLADFFKYWQDTYLDCIFANRFDPRELLESISEINKLLVEVLTDSLNSNDERKFVALYFIFCLFVKQPNRLRRKIRLTCNDVVRIRELLSDNFQSSFNKSSARFVWKQLNSMQAIDFVEERAIYGPSMLLNRGIKKGPEVDVAHSDLWIANRNDAIEFLENKIEPNLAEVIGICKPYEQIKDVLRLDDYMDPTVEVQTNGTIQQFVDQAKSLLSNFKEEFN